MTTAHFNRLLKQLSMGDMSALERLYNHYYATICSVAYCRLRKKEDAQDIASVVMIKLCSVSDKYIRNPNGFVYTLTVNCVKDFLKRKKPVVVEDFENTALVKENGNWLYVEQILASLSDVDRDIELNRKVKYEKKSISNCSSVGVGIYLFCIFFRQGFFQLQHKFVQIQGEGIGTKVPNC